MGSGESAPWRRRSTYRKGEEKKEKGGMRVRRLVASRGVGRG